MEVIDAAVIIGVAVAFILPNLALVGWEHSKRRDMNRPLPQKHQETGIKYTIRTFAFLEYYGALAVSKRVQWLFSANVRGDSSE